MTALSRPEGHDWIGVALVAVGSLLIGGTAWAMFSGVVEADLALPCMTLEAFGLFAVGYELWGDLVRWSP